MGSGSTTRVTSCYATDGPDEEGRSYFKEISGAKLEWVTCELELLRSRDTKGLYKRASLPESHTNRLGNLPNVGMRSNLTADVDVIFL